MVSGYLLLSLIGLIVLFYCNFIGVVFGANPNHELKTAFHRGYGMPMEWVNIIGC